MSLTKEHFKPIAKFQFAGYVMDHSLVSIHIRYHKYMLQSVCGYFYNLNCNGNHQITLTQSIFNYF